MTTTSTSIAVGTGRSPLRGKAVAVAAAVVAPLAVWTIVGPVLGNDLQVAYGGGTQTVGAAGVLMASLIAALAGAGTFSIAERAVRHGRTVWTVVAVAALVLSLGGPFSAQAETGTKVALALLHVTVAAVLIPLLRRSSTAR